MKIIILMYRGTWQQQQTNRGGVEMFLQCTCLPLVFLFFFFFFDVYDSNISNRIFILVVLHG